MYIPGVKQSVDTGDTYFGEISHEPISGSKEARRKLIRTSLEGIEKVHGKPLEARIEHARFIVDCPNCNSAEFYFEDKLFFCSLCKNSNVGGKVYKVKTPNDRKKIEAILGKRPIKNRHWTEPETLKDLEKENKAHGLEVKL
uniref:Uncharacterized protein n=1 Tax=viral metagenome TaxID=1070528 RepID=A0A6M3JT42_9ZZZZ